MRADAAFAKPEVYEALEEQGVKYAIRIPSNDSLERDIAELLTRPVGRPSYKPVVWYKSFLYQAASWKMARRPKALMKTSESNFSPTKGWISVCSRASRLPSGLVAMTSTARSCFSSAQSRAARVPGAVVAGR